MKTDSGLTLVHAENMLFLHRAHLVSRSRDKALKSLVLSDLSLLALRASYEAALVIVRDASGQCVLKDRHGVMSRRPRR